MTLENSRSRHTENLRWVLDEPDRWQQTMLAELAAPRFDGAWVRLHDSGDFFSQDYLAQWLEVIRARPRTRFYCYTKLTSFVSLWSLTRR